MDNQEYMYRIDANNCIVSVSDNWDTFAKANGGAPFICSDVIVGLNIWTFFAGEELKYLFKQLLKHVRQNQTVIAFPFRCDSPEERRFLELRLEPELNQRVKFISKIIKTELRSPVAEEMFRSSDDPGLIKICSMCKKLEVSEGQWGEIEEGIATLHLFNEGVVPPISHGLCRPCYRLALLELGRVRNSDRLNKLPTEKDVDLDG